MRKHNVSVIKTPV